MDSDSKAFTILIVTVLGVAGSLFVGWPALAFSTVTIGLIAFAPKDK